VRITYVSICSNSEGLGELDSRLLGVLTDETGIWIMHYSAAFLREGNLCCLVFGFFENWLALGDQRKVRGEIGVQTTYISLYFNSAGLGELDPRLLGILIRDMDIRITNHSILTLRIWRVLGF